MLVLEAQTIPGENYKYLAIMPRHITTAKSTAMQIATIAPGPIKAVFRLKVLWWYEMANGEGGNVEIGSKITFEGECSVRFRSFGYKRLRRFCLFWDNPEKRTAPQRFSHAGEAQHPRNGGSTYAQTWNILVDDVKQSCQGISDAFSASNVRALTLSGGHTPIPSAQGSLVQHPKNSAQEFSQI